MFRYIEVLKYVSHMGEGVTRAEVAAKFGWHKTNATAHLEKLRDLGWVDREGRMAASGQVTWVYFTTPKGEEVAGWRS